MTFSLYGVAGLNTFHAESQLMKTVSVQVTIYAKSQDVRQRQATSGNVDVSRVSVGHRLSSPKMTGEAMFGV